MPFLEQPSLTLEFQIEDTHSSPWLCSRLNMSASDDADAQVERRMKDEKNKNKNLTVRLVSIYVYVYTLLGCLILSFYIHANIVTYYLSFTIKN